MPLTDPDGYPQGHVNRVYEYVVAPACRKAGFFPNRADGSVHIDPFDVVKEVIDSELAIFDMSGHNQLASYGLAVRHALGLPVVLIRDVHSYIPFQTVDLNVVEYDDSLRIDTVQKAIDGLSEALQKASESKLQKHEIITRLGIGLHSSSAETASSGGSSQPEAPLSVSKTSHLPVISPLPDYVGDPFNAEEILKLKPGDELFHMNYGKGKLNSVKKMGKDELATIQFDAGTKLLVLTASDHFRKVRS